MQTQQKMSDQKVIALYRVSTERQDLTRQQVELRRAITIDDFTPEQTIEIGNKESGVLLSAAEREGIRAMQRYVEQGNISAVYVHELSRLSRRAADTFQLRDYLQAHRVQLVCLNPSIKCFTPDWQIEPTANMIFGVMASMAENEGMIRKERFRTGKARNTERGKYNGGSVLYGYRVNQDTKKFEIDPTQAEVIRSIYSTYTETQATTPSIAKVLYLRGLINGRNERVREIKILNILKCKHYAGATLNKYPQIISIETFDAAQVKLQNSKTQPRHRENQSVISYAHGLLRVRAEGGRKGYYTMQVRRSDASYFDPESKMTISAEMVDNLLFTALCYYIEDFARVNAEKRAAEMAAKATELETIARTATERAQEIQKSIDRLEERYIMGKLSEAKAEALRTQLEGEWQAHTKTAEDAIARHAQTIAEIERIQSGATIELGNLDDQARAEEIRKYVDHVDVEREKNSWYRLTITYKMSNRPEVFEVGTKKHIVYIVDEEMGKVEYPIAPLNRYDRPNRASRHRAN